MVRFWNGNKSPARQSYELELLELLLDESQVWRGVANDTTDYPNAEDEGKILEMGSDLLVTVAGNKKFAGKDFIEVPIPLCRGLLGWRLLVVSKERAQDFSGLSLNDLKQKMIGVPDTWVDAELFKFNGFDVFEKGSLEDMLSWVIDGTVDFMSLGVNEAQNILDSYPELSKSLAIEPSFAIYYPFPLVFYVNEHEEELAKWLEEKLLGCDRLQVLFDKHYGHVADQAQLSERQIIELDNPVLPEKYKPLLNKQL